MPASSGLNVNQKGIAHLFLLILLVAGIGIGIYLVQNPAIFKPKASNDGGDSVCQASDPASFRACLTQAKDDPYTNKIEITKQIICTSKTECVSTGSGGGFILNDRTRPLTIFGTPGTAAGFKRIQNYDYALLTIGGGTNEVQNITLKDLIFDDTTAECDFVTQGSGKCNTPLLLGAKIGDSTIDHITVLHSKNHGMQVSSARNLVIKNSIFYDAGGDGIWFTSAYAASCPAIVDFVTFTPCEVDMNKVNNTITIQNNLFADNAVSGIEFYSYTANPDYPNKITDNLFVHNHRNAKYIQCPNPLPNPQPSDESLIVRRGGHCPGGQLAVARSKTVIIEKNTFRDGIVDSIKPVDRYEPQPGISGKTYDQLGLKNPAIELSETLDDIKIQNNKIYNNRLALFADYIGPRYRTNNVNISWNVAYGNEQGNYIVSGESDEEFITGFGIDGYSKGGYSFDRNITDPNYSLSLPQAFIFADPPICEPQGNAGCDTKIRWYSQDQTSVNVGIKDDPLTSLGTTADGSREVPWLSTNGGVFEIRSGNTVLASTFATRFNPNIPSPSIVIPQPSVSAGNVTPDRTAGQISATPCTISSGQTQCSSTITWSTSRTTGPVKVVIKENNGMYASGNSGSQVAPWISKTPLTFQLMDGTNPTPLATVVVQATTATGQIKATTCSLPYGKTTCSSTITWSATGAVGPIKVIVKETGGLFASGNSGSQVAPWISKTPLTFQLMDGNNPTPLATIAVKSTPLIGASPNPCKLVNGRCTSKITWNGVGYPDFNIYLLENKIVFDRKTTGSLDIPFVTKNGATFQARSGTQVLDSVTLKGQ